MTLGPKGEERMVALAFLFLIVGVGLSIGTHDWTWFGRFGALMTVDGIILTGTQIIENHRRLRRSFRTWEIEVKRDLRKLSEDEHDEEMKRIEPTQPVYGTEDARWMMEAFGFYIIIVGTVVWGFGDLVGRIVP